MPHGDMMADLSTARSYTDPHKEVTRNLEKTVTFGPNLPIIIRVGERADINVH